MRFPKGTAHIGGSKLIRDVSQDPCNILEMTVLSLPNRTALASIHIGDMLEIEFRPGPPRFLVVMTKGGSAAGAIVSSSTDRLVECMQRGFGYVAKVVDLSGDICKVLVQRKLRGRMRHVF